MTRPNVKLDGKEVLAIKNYQKTNLKIHLFIKKSDDEGKDFSTIWVRSNPLILFRQLSKAKTETCRLSILNIISIFQLKMSCMTILKIIWISYCQYLHYNNKILVGLNDKEIYSLSLNNSPATPMLSFG